MKRLRSRDSLRHLVSVLVSAGLVATILPASAANAILTLGTGYQPTITETVDASGFKHPGVGLTKDMLENIRTQVLAQQEPWNTYFNSMTTSSAASTGAVSSNRGSDPTKPGTYAFNSQGVESKFIADGLKAYTQALLYYITGNEVYRANALAIIRIWEQMDPAQYAYYTDAHIHTGIHMNRMINAAEILRATSYQTSSLQWTDQDTAMFTANLIVPATDTFDHDNSHFMNQHLYPLIGAMSGYIFTGNTSRYNEGVEWLTVNKTAVDQGQNGAIKQLFRLVDHNDLTGEAVTPVVQHVEMGRDQAHGAGDVTNMSILARLLLAQGTKVDPVDGTASTAPNAVGIYDFLDDRILNATEFFSTYMLGYTVPWVPTASHTDPDGTPTIVYKQLAGGYRGRLTQNTWEPFYYYKYVKGVNIEQRAPYLTKMFSERPGYNWDGVDGGGDFWLTIPAQAAAEGSQYLVRPLVNPIRELEDRVSIFDANSVTMQEGDVGFVRTTATPEGSRMALVGVGYGTSMLAFKVRTNGVAVIEAFGDTITLPNTAGQWRYVATPHGMGDLEYFTIKGNGTTVDIDHINANAAAALIPATFTQGAGDLNVYAYTGSTQAVVLDFSATDTNAAAVLSYQIDNLPAGAVFNTSTGAFSWTPGAPGTYSFVVSATDGTTMTTRDIKVVVSADRQSSVNAAIAAFNPNTIYLSATVDAYNLALADANNTISTATDSVFYQKLAALNAAVQGLAQLTPLIADGSIDYSKMLFGGTFGGAVGAALDNNPDSFVGYFQAVNLTHTLDFGASYQISANNFLLQVRASFPERIGGVAIFGSNDNENFTRLTPGLSVVSDDMQTLPVSDDVKNLRFRFLRLQMIEPSSSMFELSEFHIYGTRYETVNQISKVGLSSDQALRNRIIAGNTVKLNFVSTKPINNVNVTIQGQPATVTSADNLNWTATWVVTGDATPGNVKFKLNYKTAEGLDAIETFMTTDGSSLSISDQSNAINNVTTLAGVTDSSGRNAADAMTTANLLFDSNMGTTTDYRVNGSGYGGWVEFDFRGGGTVTLARAEVLARQDQVGRINGVVIQGSNDNTTWENITNYAGNNADWQTLTSSSSTPYRYLRVFNGNNWYGNMSELRLYGVAKSSAQIASASLTSAQSLSPSAVLNKRVVAGNTVTLKFTAKTAINNVTATIGGQAATVSTADNVNFTASATLPQGVAAGKLGFEVDYKLADGSTGYPATATTDGSGAYVVDESDLIRNISTVATLIDSTLNRTSATTKAQVDALFDSNIGSVSDFRTGTNNSGTGAYVIFDFKAGNQVNLSSVELLARQDQVARAKYIVFQGSNDGTTWTDLTTIASATQDWQTFAVSSQVPYRYVRIYNFATWYGNMAEVRLHGSLHAADVAAPVTTDNAPAAWVKTDTTVTFTALDPSGVSATYYTVDGGARQTGKVVTLTTEGIHALTYWSVDWAGNVEPAHTASVKIDKTAPVTTATYSATPQNGWYTNAVTMTLTMNPDTGSGAAASYYTVDGGAQQTGTAIDLGKGIHTVTYWSVDQAGNAEQPQTASVNVGPLDTTASVQIVQHDATLNRKTGQDLGSVTLTNTSGAALSGPLQLKLTNLTAGVTLVNATGIDGGMPYITLPGALDAGASITVDLTFSGPPRTAVGYTPMLFKGNF